MQFPVIEMLKLVKNPIKSGKVLLVISPELTHRPRKSINGQWKDYDQMSNEIWIGRSYVITTKQWQSAAPQQHWFIAESATFRCMESFLTGGKGV